MARDPASKQTVQARGRGEVPLQQPTILQWLTVAGNIIPVWWSRQRDIELRHFWKKVDHISGAIYTFQSRLSTIPFKVVPRDMSFVSHQKQAEKFTEMLLDETQFGEGWNALYDPFIEDNVSQDNGGFMEIIGDGRPDGPIRGPVLSIAHLDGEQCTRTSDYEFPVIFADPDDGRRYKLHRTRVLYNSQMPSANTRMNGVGVCALSRCINVAQNIYDILVYKQEKLGSRPPRAIALTGGGLTPETLASAFNQASEMMNNLALSRYSKIVGVGAKEAPDASIDLIDLAGLPDGFDESTSMTLGMAAVALAFGVDARELFPALSAGATKAEALVQHLKQRGKGFGQFIQMVERKFNQKVLPPHLELVFDFQDDAQDLQVAEIKEKRAGTRVRNLVESGVTDTRTERENMLKDGDITNNQFERMELEDGRLPSGISVLSLFTTKEFADVLDLGFENPFDIRENDKEEIMEAIADKRAELTLILGQAPNMRVREQTEQALSALKALEEMYEDVKEEGTTPDIVTAIPPAGGGQDTPTEESIVTPDEQTMPSMSEELEEKEELKSQKNLITRIAEKLFGLEDKIDQISSRGVDDNTLEGIRATIDTISRIAEQPTNINVTLPEYKSAPILPAPINIKNIMPENKAETPIINIDNIVPVPEFPNVDIHNTFEVPETKQQEIKIENIMPEMPIKIDMEVDVKSPDEILETETTVDRDKDGFIKKTFKRTARK